MREIAIENLIRNLDDEITDIIVGENAIQIETADEIFVFPKTRNSKRIRRTYQQRTNEEIAEED